MKPQPHAIFAEFESVEAVVRAARKVREAGYTRWDAHTPFPVHGLDAAMGARPTRLPYLVLGAGFTGLGLALALQWWTNAVDYPFRISGKPLFGLPANIPVTFELTILLAAFAAFFGMLALNGLPAFHSPLFASRRFRRATADRFVIAIDAADPLFDPEATAGFLRSIGAAAVEECAETPGPSAFPRALKYAGALAAAVAIILPLLVLKARFTTSANPRLHLFTDMDFQPKKKPRATSALFADGRASRPPIEGTIARGALREDDRVYRGRANGAFATAIPVPVDDALMRRGQDRYDVFCAACHGAGGEGDGLVARRADQLRQPTWVPPADLLADHIRKYPDGQIFEAITNGVRAMPAYGREIAAEDRWAIVLYVRALERSQGASLGDVPAEQRDSPR